MSLVYQIFEYITKLFPHCKCMCVCGCVYVYARERECEGPGCVERVEELVHLFKAFQEFLDEFRWIFHEKLNGDCMSVGYGM